jgi:Sec-independent protein translocase protein TatA
MKLGWSEIILILTLVLIVFVVIRIPQAGAQFGKHVRPKVK